MPFISATGGAFGYGRAELVDTIPYITTGLQVYLAPTTYSGSGTTWTNTFNASANATIFNSPSFNATTGFTLNGTTQYGSLPDISSVTDFTASQDYTIEVWVRIDSTQNDVINSDNDILEKWNSGNEGAYPYVLRYLRTSGQVLFSVYNGSINPGKFITVSTNTWQQLVGVFDHTNNLLYGYKNGAIDGIPASMNISGTISNSSTLEIGRRANTGGTTGFNYFTGSVGIIRIYNTALTAAQILQNFNSDRSRFGL